ncbi:glycosyl hydrolase family 61-domain-containing protein [Mycena capillaripes]|nr:glycosyl hydrolase family 61-domain-containing protein [Mycena capillaripes]
MKSFAAILFSLSLISSTVAHGWLGTLTIAGKAYTGNKPVEEVGKGAPSVVRQIANNLPVKDLTLAEITCGRDATPAALVASAAPGDTLLLDWNTLAAGGNWFHDVGPMMTYLASCGSKSCADFDASQAKWFKIDEQGQDASGNWAQAKLDDGSPASVTLPSNLAPGNYLLRHEIIALHTAQSLGGAEFYPSCSQLTVSGSGTGAPAPSELVSLPGAYKPSDAGILIDVYNMKGAYQFPGPPVAAFVKGGSSPAAPGKGTTTTKAAAPTSTHASPSTSATKGAPATTTHAPATPSSPSSSKTCKKTRRASRRSFAPPHGAPVSEPEHVEVEDVPAPAVDARAHVRRQLHRFGRHASF